jgi:hypothetical protein
MLNIDFLHADRSEERNGCFVPGEPVIVIVSWQLECDDTNIDLRLLWETSGKGTEDSEVIHHQNWHVAQRTGEKEFVFYLPRGPLSCEGKLLSIHWAAECYLDKVGIKARKEFILSMSSSPIRLAEGKPNPGLEKIIKFLGVASPQPNG